MPTPIAQERVVNRAGPESEEQLFRWTRLRLDPFGSGEGSTWGSRPASVLVVEDESILALFLQQKLRSFGYETVDYATTGQGAIDKALQYRPALLLMDVSLRGEMDGITAVSRIQEQLRVAVVYLSAFTDPATVERAQETNCFAFLEKPVDDATLRRTIEAALRHFRGD